MLLLERQRTQEGDVIRMPVPLSLVRDRTALFALTWVPMHRIDPSSPFHGGEAALARLREMETEIFLSFTGIDETIGQQIHARYRYKLDDIVWGARFVDVLTIKPDGTRVVDYAAFHDVETIDGHAAPVSERAHSAAPSRMPISSSRDERQHSLPTRNALHESGRMA